MDCIEAMSHQPSSATLTLAVDPHVTEPAYVQLYEQVRDLILSGRLESGSRLPSTRTLATEIGVSRTTTISAYELLTSEGYLEGRIGSGAYVADVLPETVLSGLDPSADAIARAAAGPADPAAKTDSPGGPGNPAGDAEPRPRSFDPGLPEEREFPIAEWQRLIARSHRRLGSSWLFTRYYGGYPQLREAISDHLRSMRGLHCAPEQVFVTSGAREAGDLLARVLLPGAATVWIEDPGYPTIIETMRANGAVVAPVRVDDEGFDVERARREHSGARLAFVTPSRQYPLGMTLSLSRRLALIDWAQRERGWIVEDDFDSEYRYAGRPLASLMSLDDAGRVIYLGSFSKVMFNGLRLGWLVVPEDLVSAFAKAQSDYGSLAAIVAQPALAEFISTGRFSAHIRRMRKLYALRQRHLVGEIQRLCGGTLQTSPQDGGMHLVARLAPGLVERMSDTEICTRAVAQDVGLRPLSRFFLTEPREHGLVLGYASVNEAEITSGIEKLSEIVSG